MNDDSIDEKLNACPPRLRAIVEEFLDVGPRERLDLLLEYSMELPDLSAELQGARDAMEQVHECMTPVFLHTDVTGGAADGTVRFALDIPRESPTVRGYASILVEGFEGATPQEVLQTPDDLHLMLGLQEAISPQRIRGLYALLAYMKRQVQAELVRTATRN